MIYTATKNGHTSTLEVVEGDLKAKKKLIRYRREGWQITAFVAKDVGSVPQVEEVVKQEPAERRRRFTRWLGYRVALEE